MLKNLKYAIMALAFIVIVKIITGSVFDKSKYTKLRKTPYVSTPKKQAEEPKNASVSETIPLESSYEEEKSTPPPVLEREAEVEEETPPVDVNMQSITELKNGYLAPIISKIPSGQLREDVVVRYYRHEEDGEKVYTLKELGYYIHEKEAKETAGLGSNVLYYGRDVPVEDIRIIAYTLLESGVPLKSIRPTRFNWKSASVEIGTDPDIANAASLMKNDVLTFSK